MRISDWSSDVCSSDLLTWLAAHGVVDADFVAAHTCDLDATLGTARETAGDLDALATQCGVRRDRLEAFFELFAHHEKVVTLFSQGVNQSGQGTDKVNAIINCPLYKGRTAKPGPGPFRSEERPVG